MRKSIGICNGIESKCYALGMQWYRYFKRSKKIRRRIPARRTSKIPVRKRQNQRRTKTEQKDEQVEENDSKEEDSGNHEAQDQILKLYYISDSEEIECAEIRTNLLQTTDIWNGLIGEGVLSSECKMNSCNVDQEQKTIDLDVDSGTGSYIRTWGRQEKNKYSHVLKKKSFLKTYECERLKITENGRPF